MLPNIQLNWIQRFYRAKQKQWFGDEVQDWKDGSGLQFITFAGFSDWRSRNQNCHSCGTDFYFFSRYFVSSANISLLPSLLAIFLPISR